jgi:hypothetical protein
MESLPTSAGHCADWLPYTSLVRSGQVPDDASSMGTFFDLEQDMDFLLRGLEMQLILWYMIPRMPMMDIRGLHCLNYIMM